MDLTKTQTLVMAMKAQDLTKAIDQVDCYKNACTVIDSKLYFGENLDIFVSMCQP
jgi:hypothetical protein